jgi:hypothetical protein
MATLTFKKVIHQKPPQSGTWLHCFQASSGNANGTYNEKDKDYEGADATVEMNLSLTPVNLNDKCSFIIRLDDDQDDVCSLQAEDESSGNFIITESRSQNFDAGDDWSYTISWTTK